MRYELQSLSFRVIVHSSSFKMLFPQRIISLVPSLTELLYDLGLDGRVAGITKFCVHPDSWYRSKTRVGGTKNVHIDVIHRLKPDLIIANKEENTKDQIEALQNFYPVYVSDVNDLKDACEMITSVGELTNTELKADLIIKQIRQNFKVLADRQLVAEFKNQKAAYLIWRNPYMAAGSDTFIHSMMTLCGFNNVFATLRRYPVISVKDLPAMGCQWLLLSSEPYPFRDKDVETFRLQFPDMNVLLVDGQYFSWYGSRLIKAAEYFMHLQRQMSDYER